MIWLESDIPFPLLSGQYIGMYSASKKAEFYQKIVGQPKLFDLPYPYEIAPKSSIPNVTLTKGNASLFRTDYLKQWVTWIDNKFLGVTWTVNDVNLTSLISNPQPMTFLTNPFGAINFPMFIFHNVSGNVVFSLSNSSALHTITGTLHILMYDYKTENVTGTPSVFTDIDYMGQLQ
ncbi:hypothetical protein [Ferroplasma sp.]|uniref:hypothetical protein n=1 Tax=Ferroplasma sp. TaxID=2591003 RepID=UPI00260737E4|nr:hypothetical protein [Ferroplasma sp.]